MDFWRPLSAEHIKRPSMIYAPGILFRFTLSKKRLYQTMHEPHSAQFASGEKTKIKIAGTLNISMTHARYVWNSADVERLSSELNAEEILRG